MTKLFSNKYGRLLCHLFTEDGVSVQKSLLENGYARIAYLFDDYKYVEDVYKPAERKAKESRLKVWEIEGYVTPEGYNMDVINGANGLFNNINLEEITLSEIVKILEDKELNLNNLSAKDIQNILDKYGK